MSKRAHKVSDVSAAQSPSADSRPLVAFRKSAGFRCLHWKLHPSLISRWLGQENFKTCLNLMAATCRKKLRHQQHEDETLVENLRADVTVQIPAHHDLKNGFWVFPMVAAQAETTLSLKRASRVYEQHLLPCT